MLNIDKIDKNFKVETNIERENLTFYDAKKPPFRIHGVFHDGKLYRRVPNDIAYSVSNGVGAGSMLTAGGRVRFITDSPYIVLKAEVNVDRMPHMPLTGSTGFDLYVTVDGEEQFTKTFVPPVRIESSYDGVIDFSVRKERLITINFPLYNGTREVYIGLSEDAVLKEAPDYTVNKPIVFYGSSITQGGCASRPGNSYQGFISRRYDADYVNLGYSGCAKGEPNMAKYIAGLEMSVFVYDYDFNTPSVEHFWETHEPFFKTIREAHPDLPIIMMSRPQYKLNPETDKRHAVIKATYENAKAAGDKNVYLIPGNELMELCKLEGTVDITHPTDFGFYSMAVRMFKELDAILKK